MRSSSGDWEWEKGMQVDLGAEGKSGGYLVDEWRMLRDSDRMAVTGIVTKQFFVIGVLACTSREIILHKITSFYNLFTFLLDTD